MITQAVDLTNFVHKPKDKNYATFLSLQKTLRTHVSFEGVGVHSGLPMRMNIYPASINHGYVFVRSDQEGPNNRIKATWNCVSNTSMCTKISNGWTGVSTIEHIIAALWGCDIHNALIELSGEEVPIMDGSSDIFAQEIQRVGTSDLPSYKPIIEILKPVQVEYKNSWARFVPHSHFKLELSFDFGGRFEEPQQFVFDTKSDSFTQLISKARTFGFLEDGEKLKKMGLALGSSFDNTIVLDKDSQVLNAEGLRFEDEFVRHKVLDAIGDLALSQGYIVGCFQGFNSGHSLNNELLRAIFTDQSNYRILNMPLPLI